MWYKIKVLYDRFLYFLYDRFEFAKNNIKLQNRFFWLDFKKDIQKERAIDKEEIACVIAVKDGNLVYVSEFCKNREEANKVFSNWLRDTAEDNAGGIVGGVVVVLSEPEKEKFELARKLLQRYQFVRLPEREATPTKPKRSTKNKNARSRGNIKRTK